MICETKFLQVVHKCLQNILGKLYIAKLYIHYILIISS